MDKKKLIISFIGLVLFAVVGIGLLSSANSSEVDPYAYREGQISPQARAIIEAENFVASEGSVCSSIETPATHMRTGARYNFATRCIPDGWVRIRTTTPIVSTTNSDAASSNAGQTTVLPNQSLSKLTSSYYVPRNAEEALAQAAAYQPRPGTICDFVPTPALHRATGARYTFPTRCMPNSWVREAEQPPTLGSRSTSANY